MTNQIVYIYIVAGDPGEGEEELQHAHVGEAV